MLIQLRDVYKIYGEGLESEVRALDGVSLDVDRGEFVAIVGQSGSGKSTMMNVLGCLDIPTRGDYFLDGVDVRELTDRELSHIRNKQIGFIFQQYNLIQSLNVFENVELPLIYQGIGAERRRELRRRHWKRWGWRAVRSTSPRRCPAASSSGWPSPEPSPPTPLSSWPTSPPARWTPKPGGMCWRSCAPSTGRAPRYCLSPMTTASPPPPDGWYGCPTAR